MNRREFLQRIAGPATLGGFAGCLGSAGTASDTPDDPNGTDATTRNADPNGTDSTTRNADERTTAGGGERFSGVRSDREEPFRTIPVGSRDGVAFPENNRPREVRVWNAADRHRIINLRVSRDAESIVDRTVEFRPDAYLVVELNEPADYRIDVGPADGDRATVEVARSSFDCNDAGTDVGVMPDGRVETMSLSTAMGCPAPAVADADLSVGQGGCGNRHSATVTFEGEAVRVDGAVRTPTPAYGLELAEPSDDREGDAVTVRVSARSPDEDEGSVQCVGEVPYEATVAFDHGLPATVVVVHESTGETVEVTRADRGSS